MPTSRLSNHTAAARASSLATAPHRDPAAGRLRGWRTHVLRRLLDAVLGVVLYRVYAELRNEQGDGQPAPGPTATARRHGYDVLHLERALHLDIEHAAQTAVLAMPEWVVRVANVYYAGVHLPLTGLVFAWVLLTRPHRQFVVLRDTLVLGTAMALVGFGLFPTMPPRLLPGYVDTVFVHGGLWSSHAPVLEHIADPFAAMPSLHLVWALWVATALWRYGRWAWLRRLGPVHVAATCVVVVVTGNHWLLDIVAGAAVFFAAAAIRRAAGRRTRTSVAPAEVELPKAA